MVDSDGYYIEHRSSMSVVRRPLSVAKKKIAIANPYIIETTFTDH